MQFFEGKDTAMSYAMYLFLALATVHQPPRGAEAEPTPELDDALQLVLDQIRQRVEQFRSNPVTPTAVAGLENELQEHVRELARVVTRWTYNHLEPTEVQASRPRSTSRRARIVAWPTRPRRRSVPCLATSPCVA
jgi:hypothetical protein